MKNYKVIHGEKAPWHTKGVSHQDAAEQYGEYYDQMWSEYELSNGGVITVGVQHEQGRILKFRVTADIYYNYYADEIPIKLHEVRS